MATDAQLLDLEVSVRVEDYEFDVLDKANGYIGRCYPQKVAKISNDSTQGIKRRLTGLHFTPSESSSINVLTDRIRPRMVLSNGSTYNLGIFLFADALNRRMRYGLQREGSMGDQGILLSQALAASLSIPAGTLATDAIRDLAAMAGVYDLIIDSSSELVGAPLTYQGGQDSVTYVKVMTDLCGIAGFLAPYFLSSGELLCRTNPDLTTVVPTLTYLYGTRVITDSIIESNDLLTAPNKYKVVNTAATLGEIVGEYVLPPEYPHSFANRGFYITKRIEEPGVANNDQAAALAQTRALQDPKAYETVNFASPNDPRHETFDVISYSGEAAGTPNTYLELGWSMDLAPGGPMQHTAKRLFLT